MWKFEQYSLCHHFQQTLSLLVHSCWKGSFVKGDIYMKVDNSGALIISGISYIFFFSSTEELLPAKLHN